MRSNRVKSFLSVLIMIVPFVFQSCSHARPPKPGPDFVWIKPHTAPSGVTVPGHWEYAGPDKPGSVWVPGHRAAGGEWVAGHWKSVPSPRPGAKWIPGHQGPRGKWIPGHWR